MPAAVAKTSTPPSVTPPRPRRWGVTGLLEAAGALALAGTLWAALGRWFWFAELAQHFRAQMAAVLLIAAAASAGRRARRTALMWLAGAAINLAVLIPGWWRAEVPSAATGARLRVLSLNVLSSNGATERARQFIAAQNADVVVLLEVNAAWADSLRALAAQYPERVVVAREDNFGIALLSRRPLRSRRVRELGPVPLPSIEVSFAVGNRTVTLLATHPLPPISARHTAARDAQLQAAGRRLRAAGGPALLIGDFNTTPWTAGFRRLKAVSGLRDTLAGHGWQPSWPAALGWAGIPIDHCLVSREWRLQRRWMGPALGSDHRPLLVELRLP